MKRKTIFLTLIFTFVIALIIFLPSEANATVTLDSVINIDGTNLVPRIGEEPGQLSDTEYYEIVSQTWGEEGNLSGMTGKFEEGKNYTFSLTIKPKEGYEFSSSGVDFNFSNIKWIEAGAGELSKDGTASFTGKCTAVKTHKLTVTSDDGATVTPNGTMDIYTGYSKEILIIPNKGYAIESVKVNGGETFSTSDVSVNENGEYVLTVTCEDEEINVVIKIKKGIETVEVTGATLPKVGKLPVTDGLKVPDSANYKIVNAVWGTYSSTEGPFISFKEIKTNEKFVKGKEYALQVTLQSLDESIFFERTMMYINGVAAYGEIGRSEVIAYLAFEELKENYFLNNTEEQKFTIGTDRTITFNVDAPLYYIVEGGKIFVDDEELLETNYYTNIAKDSYNNGIDYTTEITLEEEYMKTLKPGKHTIKFVFYNGIEAETTFTIIDSKQSGGNKDNTTDNNSTDIDNTSNGKTNNPQTGDNIMLYIAILGIATIGIVVTTRLRKNN